MVVGVAVNNGIQEYLRSKLKVTLATDKSDSRADLYITMDVHTIQTV